MLIIITGLPGTGKTTFALALATALQAQHFNTDMLRTELGLRGRYDDVTRTSIYEEMMHRSEKSLRAGVLTIIDGTFYKKEVRQPFMEIAAATEVPLLWIELKAGEEVIRERVSKQRPHSEADFEVYQKVKEQYEPLEEQKLVFHSDQLEIEDMVGQTRAYLQAQSLYNPSD